MTIQEALYAHTIGSARAAFEENVKDSLEPGKYADLVIWNDDFYSVHPRDLLKIEAEQTFIGGKII